MGARTHTMPYKKKRHLPNTTQSAYLSSISGAGSSILNGSGGTLSRYTGWKKLEKAKPNGATQQHLSHGEEALPLLGT